MRTTRHEPWGMGAGLVFVVLLAAGLCLLSLPGGESVAHKITALYAGEGEQAQLIFGSYLLATAAVFFYWSIEIPSGPIRTGRLSRIARDRLRSRRRFRGAAFCRWHQTDERRCRHHLHRRKGRESRDASDHCSSTSG
jgi:hypothetical protein